MIRKSPLPSDTPERIAREAPQLTEEEQAYIDNFSFQNYSNNMKVPVATESAISSSSVAYPSVTSPLIARQLGASPLSGLSVVASIEKLVCLEILAFMLLGLPAKQYCL